MRGTSGPPRRSTYRHGDLRHALLAAGIELARAGGPDAVVLREATRRVGVVPNAAYRHFANRQALLMAVRAAALSALAVAMENELAGLGPRRRPAAFARASLRAVGTAYLRFAQAETGLFRTAFSVPDDPSAGPARNIWPGPSCMAWPCSSSKARSAGSSPRSGRTSGNDCWTWWKRGFRGPSGASGLTAARPGIPLLADRTRRRLA
jgi:AcrR family transcriptional regulator